MNNSDTAKLVTYVITPYTTRPQDDHEKCTGINDTVLLWVEPTPVVDATPLVDTICDGGTTSIALESDSRPTKPVRFRYTFTEPFGVTVTPGGATEGLIRGDTIIDQIVNVSDTAKLVTYVVTPYTTRAQDDIEKCTGVNDTVYVWVEPTVEISAAGDTICNIGTTDIALSSQQVPTRAVYYTYTSTPENAGAVTGNGFELLGQPITTNITETLTNGTNDAQRVIYSIVPYVLRADGSLGCPGDTIKVDIWVEPTVEVNAAGDTICDMGFTDIDVNSGQYPTREVYYTYTSAPDNAVAVTGNTQNLVGLPITDNIQDPLDNSTDSAQRVVYTITPYVLRSDGSIGCPGDPITVDIWVEPTPVVVASPSIDTICGGDVTSIALESDSRPTKPVRFRYTFTEPFGVVVTPGGPVDGFFRGDTISDQINNYTDSTKLVTYVITPYTTRPQDDIEKCTGINDTVYVWVEPTPVVIATPESDTICNGDDVSIALESPTRPPKPVRFRYTFTEPYDVIVTPAGAQDGLVRGDTITDNIVNNSDTAKLVTYVITPYTTRPQDDQEKCTGINDTVWIWVEPTPRVDATPELDTICDGDNVSIALESDSRPTKPVRFRYTFTEPFGVTVTPGGATEGLNRGDTITDQIVNITDTAKLVTYVVTPYTTRAQDDIEKCTGVNDTVYVWVEPTPRVDATPVIDTICNEGTTSIALESDSRPTKPVRFRYTFTEPFGVTVTPGGSTEGLIRGDTIIDQIVNVSDTAKLVTYVVTPYTTRAQDDIEKCTGVNDTVYVWVEPTPMADATPVMDTICDGDNVSIALESDSRPTKPVRFRYTFTEPYDVIVTPAEHRMDW